MLERFNKRTVSQDSGAIIAGANVRFFNQLTGDPVNVYSDPEGEDSLGNSINSDVDGRIAVFRLPLTYRIEVWQGITLVEELTYDQAINPIVAQGDEAVKSAILDMRIYTLEETLVEDSPPNGKYVVVEENNYAFYKVQVTTVGPKDITLDSGMVAVFQFYLSTTTPSTSANDIADTQIVNAGTHTIPQDVNNLRIKLRVYTPPANALQGAANGGYLRVGPSAAANRGSQIPPGGFLEFEGNFDVNVHNESGVTLEYAYVSFEV